MAVPKVVVLGAMVVGIGAVVTWRIRDALREPPGDEAGGGEGTGECKRIQEEVERKAPEGSAVPGETVVRPSKPPTTPYLRLATLRHPGTLEAHKRVLGDRHRNYDCMVARAASLGGNAIYVESVDDQVAGMAIGQGEVVEGVYLLHAGSVPAPARERLRERACVALEVFPGESADRSGLKEGDILVSLDGSADGSLADTCWVAERLRQVPPEGTAKIQVLRAGIEQTLSLTKHGNRFGYEYKRVPILIAAALAQ